MDFKGHLPSVSPLASVSPMAASPTGDAMQHPAGSLGVGHHMFQPAPKSTRGRRPAHTAPASKKIAQQREAQKRHLERKQAYVTGLEMKVTELTALIAGASSESGQQSIQERLMLITAENNMLQQEANTLRQRIAQLELDKLLNEQQFFSPPSLSASCLNCQLHLNRIEALENQAGQLRAEVSHHKAQYCHLAALAPTAAKALESANAESSPCATSTSPVASTPLEWMDESPEPGTLSATAMYGPPKTEATRIALKSLPSLQNNRSVDRIMDLFIHQSNALDRNVIAKYAVRIISSFHKLLDQTPVLERQRVMEIVAAFIDEPTNNLHMLHAFNTSVSTATNSVSEIYPGIAKPLLVDETPQLVAFRFFALGIPGLSGCKSLVDELFCLFFVPKTEESSQDQDLKNFLRIFSIVRLLLEACSNLEDRTKVMLLFETWRFGNRTRMDELTDEIQHLVL
ncbi:hypothetical protein BC830DRAFT_1170193 [Chytriomyces sp. MP71]|nr:hypothetical protein BC830DRAFT_1170193 [Chytriomyces sp. MP71]